MTRTKVADQRFSLKQWFAGGAQSRGLRKPGCGHCYLRFFEPIARLFSLTVSTNNHAKAEKGVRNIPTSEDMEKTPLGSQM